MPKREIDYSTRMIYFYKFVKIDDPSFTDCYVGHTINIIERRYKHKVDCHNPNKKTYNYKIYKTIRENGGWENWKMLVIHQQICKDDIEARQIEQKFIEELNSTMNTVKAYISKEEKLEKNKEYHKEFYENNKEKIKEYHKEFYENNKEQILEYHKEYYKNNKEEINKKNKEYNENNKQKLSELKKTYYENNKEQHKKLLKNWYNKNKNKVLEKHYCECGGKFVIQQKLRHERTLKHQAYCLSLNELK
jgi:hypothetical protein